MHGTSSTDISEPLSLEVLKKRAKLLMKESGSTIVLGVSISWLILVVFLHFLGRAGAWSCILLTQAAILLYDAFTLITLQEYSDGVIREAADVKKTVDPLNSLAVIFRAFAFVETLQVGSWVLPIFVYLPLLAYELGFLRKFPSKSINVNTLWKDCDPLKTEARYKIIVNLILFFVCMFVMLATLLGGKVRWLS